MRRFDAKSAARRIMLVASLLLPWLPRTSAGELPRPLVTPQLAEAARRGWLRVRIVSGRITLHGARLGTINDTASTAGREERLSVRIAGQELAVSYEMSSPDEQFRLEVSGPDQLRIQRIPKGEAAVTPVEFRQSPEQPLRLAVGAGDHEQVFEATSLWHLFIMQPEACQTHLVPLLEPLEEQWDLAGTAREVEAAMLRAAAEGNLPDPTRWTALVEQLGDDRFSRREAADRELRSLGRVVYTFLQRLDPRQLDAEQHYRVRRIVMSLRASMDNDSPPEIASWLAGDPAVWLALLTRQDEPTRKLAAERLSALLGEPITFDPVAEAAVRAQQIERLRPRVLETR